MDETYTETFDDLEFKAGRRIKGSNKVEVEVTGLGRIQIDLNDANLGTLQEAVKPFFAAGTKVATKSGGTGGTTTRKSTVRKTTGTTKTKSGADDANARFNQAVREHAQANGIEVKEKGRVSNAALAAYKEHNPNWERDFFLDQADDSAPAAPVQASTSVVDDDEPVASPGPTQNVDEHGWEREPDTTFAGAGTGSYSG